ncbi:hypothetical protein Pfo_004447 [Paulownia fortunei]|nr:hypothetical protein Pfo_004447 [Paulownia fortunei]
MEQEEQASGGGEYSGDVLDWHRGRILKSPRALPVPHRIPEYSGGGTRCSTIELMMYGFYTSPATPIGTEVHNKTSKSEHSFLILGMFKQAGTFHEHWLIPITF